MNEAITFLVLTVERQYDILDRLTNLVWRNASSAVIRSFAYSYNPASMITNIVRENGEKRIYTYDNLDRLTHERVEGASTNNVRYLLDLAGNRTRKIVNGLSTRYTLGMGNKLSTFGYGQMSEFHYDAAGNVTNALYDGGWYFFVRDLHLSWDGAYRLTTASNSHVGVEFYGYDAFDRRLWISDGTTTNYLVHAGPHIVAETDSAGTLTRSYTYGPGIDNILSMTVYSGGTTATYWYITDHLNTVWALVDEAGTVVESYDYDVFGNVTVFDEAGAPISESAVGNRFLFQGREYSFTTGLYYFRARYYDPVTGRWLSKDPIGIAGGLNQYVAFGNNPVMFVDPLGLWSWDAGMFFRGLGGAVVSGAGAVVGAAAATTGVGSVPGGALALYSSYQFGANIGNMVNSFRGVEAAPTGPIATATVLATDNRTARNIAEAADLAIPLALSIGTSPVAWSRLPTAPVGRAGTLAGTLQRVPGDPAVIYPWIRGFQIGHAGLTAHDAWQWAWDNDSNKSNPCK